MRIGRRIFYTIKARLKHRSTWAVLLILLFLAAVYRGITLPDPQNTEIGIYKNDSAYADATLGNLTETDGGFHFTVYEDERALRADVLSGKLECAFIFAENFDKLIETGKLKRGIRYLYSPYTTKGAVAKEVLYAAFLKDYSSVILSEDIGDIFLTEDSEARAEIEKTVRERNEYYQDSSEIFMVTYE